MMLNVSQFCKFEKENLLPKLVKTNFRFQIRNHTRDFNNNPFPKTIVLYLISSFERRHRIGDKVGVYHRRLLRYYRALNRLTCRARGGNRFPVTEMRADVPGNLSPPPGHSSKAKTRTRGRLSPTKTAGAEIIVIIKGRRALEVFTP